MWSFIVILMYIILLNKLRFDQISFCGRRGTSWQYGVPKWHEMVKRLGNPALEKSAHCLTASTMTKACFSTLTWRTSSAREDTSWLCWYNATEIAFSDASVSTIKESFSSIKETFARTFVIYCPQHEAKSSFQTLIANTVLTSCNCFPSA